MDILQLEDHQRGPGKSGRASFYSYCFYKESLLPELSICEQKPKLFGRKKEKLVQQ